MPEAQKIADEVIGVSRQVLFAGVVKTYRELNLATHLAVARSAAEVASRVGTNPEATERFLNAAAFLGLVVKSASDTFVHSFNAPTFETRQSEALFWLVRAKLVDILRATPLTTDEISVLAGESVSDHLATAEAMGWLARCGSKWVVSPEVFSVLGTAARESLVPRLVHFDRVMAPMFDRALTEAVRSGKSQWQKVFGAHVTNPFTLYRDEPELLETFMRGMRQLNADDDLLHAKWLAKRNPKRALDIGGGSGAFALRLAEASPCLERVHIYELPEAVEMLCRILSSVGTPEPRIEFVVGSFLAPSTPGLQGLAEQARYDLVSLGWILHDWNDDVARSILKRARHHLAPGGMLAILELLLPEDRVGPATLLDMSMLLQTEGRERTFAEFQALLGECGYTGVREVPCGTRRQLLVAAPA